MSPAEAVLHRDHEIERRLEQIEAIAHVGDWTWHRDGGAMYTSAECCSIFGKPSGWRPTLHEVLAAIVEEDRGWLGITLKVLLANQSPEATFDFCIDTGGRQVHLHTSAVIEYDADGAPLEAQGTVQDVTELKGYQQRLHLLACYDPLTELPNREFFTTRLSEAIGHAQEHELQVGVMIMDLDNFKEVNETLGHRAGDQVLRETAERLHHCVRDRDVIARLGGDEFGVMLPAMRPDADIGKVCRKMLETISEPFTVDGMEIFLTGSIGVARYPADGGSISELLQFADATLYHAKDIGRNNYQFYSANLTRKVSERLSLATRLHRAETNGELELYYQPQIDLEDRRVIGAEALLRWNHPEEGLLGPDRFIGIAEDTGLIVSIGYWVLRTACLAARNWNRGREHPLKIAVNVSARQFKARDLVPTFRDIFAETRCSPQWIEIEITESLLLDKTGDVVAKLSALHELGLSISIDDFGTGYSSLSYLTRLPVESLKIDRSFVSAIAHRRESAELVKAIIAMAKSLNFTLVAEGIEDRAQELFLRLHGCECGQGYLYGRPLPYGEFEALAAPPGAPAALPRPIAAVI
ncbi:MAG: putative bifunctional diguanylate cyclase/phosphodiesterase [Ignavibacteria bacterium]